MIPRAKLERSLAAGKVGALKLSEALFIIWVFGVTLFWVGSSPDSAPQQAALAGQALVLVCIPYCTLSVLQRSWAARDARRDVTAETSKVV